MIKYVRILTLMAFVAGSMSSCLKDKSYNNGTTGLDVIEGQRLVQLGGAYQAAKSSSVALDFVDQPVTPTFAIARLLTGDVAMEDIVITLDTAGLSSGPNSILPAGVVKLPNAFYTIPGGLTITIPKGSKDGVLKINTNAIQFDPSTTYGLGFKISSVTPSTYAAAANFSTFYTTIGAKNQYDGVYTLEWTNYHPSSNPGYTGSSTTVHMVTTGGNKVKIFWPLLPGFACPSILGGGLSYFGAQEPEYTISAGTNVVTVQNSFSTATTFYSMAPGFNSRYEPATKEIYAKWGYSSGGTYPPFDPANAREWTQKFTYVGPR